MSLFTEKTGIRRYIGPKRVIALFGLLVLVLGVWHLWRQGMLDPKTVRDFHTHHPFASIALFVFVYSVSVMSTVPTLPFNLAAGIFWGAWMGGVASAAGATVGAMGSFAIARWILGQPLARRFPHARVQRLQELYAEHGWKFVAFARLNPIFPTGLLNYLFGLTSIGLVPYSWATALFLLPPSLAVAWLGREIGSFTLHGETGRIWQSVLAGSAAITILCGLRLAAKLFAIPDKSAAK